jgi:hypothetical protein
VLKVIDLVDNLGDRITGPDLFVELAVDSDVNVLVYRGAEYGARFLPVKGWQIAPPSCETDPQWCPRNDQENPSQLNSNRTKVLRCWRVVGSFALLTGLTKKGVACYRGNWYQVLIW